MYFFYRLFINKEEDIMIEKGELNLQVYVFGFSSDFQVIYILVVVKYNILFKIVLSQKR